MDRNCAPSGTKGILGSVKGELASTADCRQSLELQTSIIYCQSTKHMNLPNGFPVKLFAFFILLSDNMTCTGILIW
jgi:hypothetical protein